MKQSVFLINNVYYLELSRALDFLKLIDRCAESKLIRYRSHAAKITRTFQQSIKVGNFAQITRDLLKMSRGGSLVNFWYGILNC